MRYLSIFLLCSISFLVTNCATSRSSSSTQIKQVNEDTFRTGLVRTDFGLDVGGLGNSIILQYQVKAQCKDNNCNSVKASLSFYLRNGTRKTTLYNKNLSISAGDKNYSWSQKRKQNIWYGTSANGRIIIVPLSKSQLHQIAKNKDVSGYLTGSHFAWSYENRKPIRLLIKQLKHFTK